MVIIGPGLSPAVDEMLTSEEYLHVDMFIGIIVAVLRTSIGDFDFSGLEYANQEDAFLYFVAWVLCVLLANIIFLNFIIAELSNIYEKVSTDLSAMQNLGKAEMVSEIELIIPERLKSKE